MSICFVISYSLLYIMFSSFRYIELGLIMIIIAILSMTSNIPLGVEILQTLDNPQGSKNAAIIMIAVSLLASFMMFLFRIFIWCRISTESNTLISFSTVILLSISSSVPIIFKVFNIVVEQFLLFFYIIIILRSFIIPLNVLLSHKEIRSNFFSEMKSTMVFVQSSLTSTFSKCTYNLMNIFKSNQVEPMNVIDVIV